MTLALLPDHRSGVLRYADLQDADLQDVVL